MGILQSKKRSNKCDSCTQTPIFGRYTVKSREFLGRCSTFSIPISASPAGAAAAVRSLSTRSVLPPLSKRTKYDPVYVLWKNAFEDQKARSPRKVSPIREEKPCTQNITGVVAGQLTPKGFPSYTDLNHKQVISHEESKEKLALKARRCLPLHMSMRRHQPYEKTLQKAAQDSQTPERSANHNATIESCYEYALTSSYNGSIVASAKDIAQTDLRAMRNAINNEETFKPTPKTARPRFLSKIPVERAMIIDKLMAKIKYRNTKSSDGSEMNVIVPPKPAIPKLSLTPKCNSPVFLKKLPNQQAQIIEKIYIDFQDLSETYAIRKGYYYL